MTQKNQPERLALTIDEFSAAHGFSPAMYFKEKKAGRGPRELKVGRRRFITLEAAAEWRAEREAAQAMPKGSPVVADTKSRAPPRPQNKAVKGR